MEEDKRDTERPNKNYARAPGWSNVQYQIRGYTVHPKDLVKVRATYEFAPGRISPPPTRYFWGNRSSRSKPHPAVYEPH